jgi:hypothetical protein
LVSAPETTVEPALMLPRTRLYDWRSFQRLLKANAVGAELTCWGVIVWNSSSMTCHNTAC